MVKLVAIFNLPAGADEAEFEKCFREEKRKENRSHEQSQNNLAGACLH